MAMANLQAVVLWSAVAFAVYCALILLARSARLVGRGRARRQWQQRIHHAPERHSTPSVFLNPTAVPDRRRPPPETGQLGFVMAAEFIRRRVMNRDEFRVFQVIEDELAANWRGHRAFAQTAVGEIIESPDRDAHGAIDGKHTDIVVVDPDGYAVLAVEVRTKAHQQEASARDAVKKEALRRAGVSCLEVLDYHNEADIARMLRETLGRAEREHTQPAA